MAIDFVITWVDGNDPDWQMEKLKMQTGNNVDDRVERYRDYGFLRYWFRGVCKFAPWVRKIHFVTYGHIPAWLDTNNPKLQIVKHSDFIPPECLPTFNSNAIEMYLHRIPDLAEEFVYFNDDMFFVDDVKETDFFVDKKPVDMFAFQPIVANPANDLMGHTFLNNMNVIARHFSKKEVIRRHFSKIYTVGYPLRYWVYNWVEMAFDRFTGMYTVHGPMSLKKQTFEKLWELEGEHLQKTGQNAFRSKEDLTIYLMREWQKLQGEFVPCNLHRKFEYFELGKENAALAETIAKQKRKQICINDANEEIDFERTKQFIEKAFLEILPDACMFEQGE